MHCLILIHLILPCYPLTVLFSLHFLFCLLHTDLCTLCLCVFLGVVCGPFWTGQAVSSFSLTICFLFHSLLPPLHHCLLRDEGVSVCVCVCVSVRVFAYTNIYTKYK